MRTRGIMHSQKISRLAEGGEESLYNNFWQNRWNYPSPVFTWSPWKSKELHPAVSFSRGSSGAYFDGNGILRYANSGVPRFDHDPLTGICKGLFEEGASTNLLLYSEQFDNAAWTKTRASITANAATAPDGTMTADKLVEDSTASNSHYVSSSTITVVASSVHCGSAYVEAKERQYVKIQLGNGFGNAFAAFNLATGSVISFGNGALSYGIIHAGNGRYRVYVTASSSTTSGSLLVAICDASGNSTYTGDGTSGLYIWGAQLEAGTGPTSYLPTTTAGVTRAADVCTVDLTQLKRNGFPLWGGAEGTIVVDGIFPNSSTPIIKLDDGTSANTIGFSKSSSGLFNPFISASSAYTVDANGGTLPATRSKLVFAFKANDAAWSMNGGSVGTDSSVTLPSVTTMYLSGGSKHLRSVQLYNRRIADAYLPALSRI